MNDVIEFQSKELREANAAKDAALGARECDIMQDHRLSRTAARRIMRENPPETKGKRRIKADKGDGDVKVKLPEKSEPDLTEPEPDPEQVGLVQFLIDLLSRLVLGGTGVVLGGVGVLMNYQFASAFGSTWLDALAFGLIAAAGDVATVLLPSNIFGLIRRKRWGQFALTVPLWLTCAVVSSIASVSFAASHVGDTAVSRGTVAQQRATFNVMLQQAEQDRRQNTEPRSVAAIEFEIQREVGRLSRYDVTSPKLAKLQAAREDAARRDKLDADILDINAKLAALPAVAEIDAGAEQFSRLLARQLAPDQVSSLRIWGYALAPHLSGLLIALARAV